MNLDESEDQQQLRGAVARWVAKSYGVQRRRQVLAAGGFDRESYAELAQLGLTGLWVPERQGGMGLGAVEAMVTMEELGKGLVLEPLPQSFISAALIARYAPEALQVRWLPELAAGQALIVLAHHESGARYRLDACESRAVREEGQWRLTGAKSLVPAGDAADAWLVPARTHAAGGECIALFLVERSQGGLRTRGYSTQDGSRAAELQMASVRGELLTHDGLPALEEAADIGLASACAKAIGVMNQLMVLTVDYLKARQQFGVPIASFQALRHRVADMKTELEMARSMSCYASLMLDRPREERRLALARAKVQVGRSMRFVGQQAVQLHGGIALTDECIVSHYFKTLTQIELSWGDTLHHLAAVSDKMQNEAGVFV